MIPKSNLEEGFLEEAVLNLTPKNEWALLKDKEHDFYGFSDD